MHTVSYTSFHRKKVTEQAALTRREKRKSSKASRAAVSLAWELRLSRSILCPPF